MRMRNEAGVRRPTHQRDPLAAEAMQRQDGDAPGHPGEPLGRADVDGDALQVLGMELAKLNEEHAAIVAPRCVPRSRRVADVGARRIFAQFVREGALDDQKLLAKCACS